MENLSWRRLILHHRKHWEIGSPANILTGTLAGAKLRDVSSHPHFVAEVRLDICHTTRENHGNPTWKQASSSMEPREGDPNIWDLYLPRHRIYRNRTRIRRSKENMLESLRDNNTYAPIITGQN